MTTTNTDHRRPQPITAEDAARAAQIGEDRAEIEAALVARLRRGESFSLLRWRGFYSDLREGYATRDAGEGVTLLVRYRTQTYRDDGLGSTGWGTVRRVIARHASEEAGEPADARA